MSQPDPTLPRPDIDTLTESDLIKLVKYQQNSAALLALVNRHTGIYFQVVNRYAAAYPSTISARDMDDDKLFNLYNIVTGYDPKHGKTLCGYIHDRTDFLCKTMLRKDENNPIAPGTYLVSGSAPGSYTTSNGVQAIFTDESASSNVVNNANADLGVEEILKTAHEVSTDPRFFTIWDYRHNQGMSWRQIGAKLGVSHEGARKVIYQSTMDKVKERLKA